MVKAQIYVPENDKSHRIKYKWIILSKSIKIQDGYKSSVLITATDDVLVTLSAN